LHKALTAPLSFAWLCLTAKHVVNETSFMANQVTSNALSGPDH
jgi:hypothetical protein